MGWSEAAARAGVLKPAEGDRTWSIDPAAADELRQHCTAPAEQDGLLRQFAEQAMESLDGYSGTLGHYLQSRSVRQDYHRIASYYPLLGPVMDPAAAVFEWRPQPDSADWTALTHDSDWHIYDGDEGFGAALSIEAYDEIWDAVIAGARYGSSYYRSYYESYYGGMGRLGRGQRREYYNFERRPLVRMTYTAGYGANVSSLPADLRYLVYVTTQRLFDYRDGYGTGLPPLSQSAAMIMRKYRRGARPELI